MSRTDQLRRLIEAIPDHHMDGYECEWGCESRWDSPVSPRRFPDCTWDNPEHGHELISRERVLAAITKVYGE